MGAQFNQDVFDRKGDIKAQKYPPGHASKDAFISSREQYDQMYKQSIEEPDVFWGNIAKDFYWKKTWQNPVRR